MPVRVACDLLETRLSLAEDELWRLHRKAWCERHQDYDNCKAMKESNGEPETREKQDDV